MTDNAVRSKKNNRKIETTIIQTGVPTIPEQIIGNYFGWPNKVKKGTRWFYILCLISVLVNIVIAAIATIYILFNNNLGDL